MPSIRQCFVYLVALIEDPKAAFWPETYGPSLVCLSVQSLFNVER